MKLFQIFPLSIMIIATAFIIAGCGGPKCISGGYAGIPCEVEVQDPADFPNLFE